jgi:hypothetical protein
MMEYVDREELDIWEKEDFVKALGYYKDTLQKMDADATAGR